MATRGLIGSMLVLCVLAGCGEKKAPDLPQPQADGVNRQTEGGVIPQAQLDALKKAKGVDDLSRENDQRLQAIDKQ